MEITINLNNEDLEHFRRAMQQAVARNSGLSAPEVCAHATALLERVRATRVPDFVAERMRRLVALITMVQDEAWPLNEEERSRALGALSYFAEPHDDIPDALPVFGFLDDAIMIELVLRELRHELEAYGEFCVFRASEASRGGDTGGMHRDAWLTQRRDELMDRMRRRRANAGTYASTSPFSLFTTR
ncbi:YkvA family protein [Pseudofulvimonas gallinarii]|uniref:Uncharacterized protein DUF1232 n=1 Tax=Pseudofulvimonas gallinarii TaxID=634155 RepID=A0A4S3KTQ1_9GAMM|nr:YkvA family protein [Pseudofulvimonas gallinarii]TCS97196.1 uncharacterized protein DUF1232 [Pseudofulvimonas gallinarii]THD12529.1 hypothetical protein B1808_12400 [Pseudofulvimonas gallinarii]